MNECVLYLGNRNYSSWSMRAWLAIRQSGLPFREVRFHLGETGVRLRIRQQSPSGRVPALHHGERVIWDSLAICEYLAEQAPEAKLWPQDAAARAHARAVTAEMHAGFAALRTHMPLNVRRSCHGRGEGPGVTEDIDRILGIWRDCRARFSGGGPFLFGEFGIADAFYAPVVSRFRTYAVDLPEECAEYAGQVWRHAPVRVWAEDARAESWVEPEFDL